MRDGNREKKIKRSADGDERLPGCLQSDRELIVQEAGVTADVQVASRESGAVIADCYRELRIEKTYE